MKGANNMSTKPMHTMKQFLAKETFPGHSYSIVNKVTPQLSGLNKFDIKR